MSFQSKKVLVTGGLGFIGSNLALRLSHLGAKVTVIDSLLKECGGNYANLENSSEIEVIEEDVRDQTKASRHFKDQDYVFALAGLTDHKLSITQPFLDLCINVEAQLSTLELVKNCCPEAVVVHTGTRQVYGKPQYLPVDEAHPICPPDINGIHKLAGEEYYRLFFLTSKIRSVRLRLTNTFGPHQKISNPGQGVLGFFIYKALRNETIQLYGGGSELRDINYVDDCVDALIAAANCSACYGDVFNLSGPRISLKDFAQQVVEICGSGKVEEIGFPEEMKIISIGNYYGSSDKFSDITKWKSKTATRDAIAKSIEYFRKNPDTWR